VIAKTMLLIELLVRYQEKENAAARGKHKQRRD